MLQCKCSECRRHYSKLSVWNCVFQNLHRMSMLLLNRNAISFIELDSFSMLTHLKRINLANNRIESFDNRIFEANAKLIDVDLSANKFMHLKNEPILKSQSIQVSDLFTMVFLAVVANALPFHRH